MTVTVVEHAPGETTETVTETTVDAAAEAAIQAETSAVVAAEVADGVVALAHQQAAAAELDAAATVAEVGANWQELSTRITHTETLLSEMRSEMAALTEAVSSIRSPPVVVTEVEEIAPLIEPAETRQDGADGHQNQAVEAVKKLYRARL